MLLPSTFAPACWTSGTAPLIRLSLKTLGGGLQEKLHCCLVAVAAGPVYRRGEALVWQVHIRLRNTHTEGIEELQQLQGRSLRRQL